MKLRSPRPSDQRIEITWANNFSAPEADDNYVQKQLEQKFNVKIKNVKFDRQGWKDKFNVLLASGQIPDIFPIDADETDMASMGGSGHHCQHFSGRNPKNMPNYTKALESIDAGAWNVGFYNGKNWGIPKVWPTGNSGMIPGYNEAWLKKIGYNEPPKTLAELEDVLTKFVNNDPDGNGKKDTYGMSGRGKLPSQLFTSVFSAYGVSPYQFKLGADGKVVYGGITEETRNALKLLNKWFEAGLIDPEFITADNGSSMKNSRTKRSVWSITWVGATSTPNPTILRNPHWRRANTLSPESRLSDRPAKRTPSPPACVKPLYC